MLSPVSVNWPQIWRTVTSLQVCGVESAKAHRVRVLFLKAETPAEWVYWWSVRDDGGWICYGKQCNQHWWMGHQRHQGPPTTGVHPSFCKDLRRITFLKRTTRVLPCTVRKTPVSGVPIFYTDGNESVKAGCKSENLSKVIQNPYNSVKESELNAILMVLRNFAEPLDMVSDSWYVERVVLHMETDEFIHDETGLTLLFIQLQDIIRTRTLYIISHYIWYMCIYVWHIYHYIYSHT